MLDEDGQPLDTPPVAGRRKSKLMTPVPQPRKKGKAKAPSLPFGDELALDSADQKYNPTPIINEIRSHLESWRALPNPADWGVTHTTARLLTHWRTHAFSEVKPFFCQIEAAETIIWLIEVASKPARYRRIWEHIRDAKAETMKTLWEGRRRQQSRDFRPLGFRRVQGAVSDAGGIRQTGRKQAG